MLLDLTDDDSNKDDTIYFNNDAHNSDNFSQTPSRLFRGTSTVSHQDEDDDEHDAMWGDAYPFKPVAQSTWEDKVRVAAVTAAAVDVHTNLTSDLRPRIYDYNSKQWLLVDSGAAVSCFPKSFFPAAKLNPNQTLQAVNGAVIKTYGSQNVKLNFGGKTYQHDFIISDLSQAIALHQLQCTKHSNHVRHAASWYEKSHCGCRTTVELLALV